MKLRLLPVTCTAFAAGCLAAAGIAAATTSTLPGGNLLQNAGAEAGPGSEGSGPPVAIPGWTTTTIKGEDSADAGFTVVRYGATSFPDPELAATIHGGSNFFTGGDATAVSAASQNVDVSRAATEIDAGGVTASLAADIGGFGAQHDSGVVTATFLDESGAKLAGLKIGPVTYSARGNDTKLLPRSASAAVPKGTRTITVTMAATRTEGRWNDGYFDNLDLELKAAAKSTSTAAKPHLSVGCKGRSAVAAVTPSAGISSVRFTSTRHAAVTARHAPFKATVASRVPAGHNKLNVRALIHQSAGGAITLRKTLSHC
jgi:hypothetical protein